MCLWSCDCKSCIICCGCLIYIVCIGIGASYSVESLHIISLYGGKNIFVFLYKLNFVTLVRSPFTWAMFCLFTAASRHCDPFSDTVIVGVIRNVLSWSWACSNFLGNLYVGIPRSHSREMKWLSTTMHPMCFWASFRLFINPIFMTAEIFSGLASMPCSKTMDLSCFPDGTQQHIFWGWLWCWTIVGSWRSPPSQR